MSEPRQNYQADMLAWIQAWRADGANAAAEPDFAQMALALFHEQFETIAAFRTFCLSRQRTPQNVQSWQQIPCVPISAFKFAQLYNKRATDRPMCRFETSGTSDAQRGHIQLSDTALYDASALATFHHWLVPDKLQHFQYISLVPNASVRPNASLGHMIRRLAQQLGSADMVEILGHELDRHLFVSTCENAAQRKQPVLIFATTIAVEALLQHWPQGLRLGLPTGSRLMDTGGPKGRSVAVDRDQQHRKLADMLGIDRDLIVGEYGMTELSSQRYETTCRHKLLSDVCRQVVSYR